MTVTLPLVMFHAGTVEFNALLVFAHVTQQAAEAWWPYNSQTLAILTGLNQKKISMAIAWLDRRGLLLIERESKLIMRMRPAELSDDWQIIWDNRQSEADMNQSLKELNRSIKTKPMPLAAQAVLSRA